MEVLLNHKSQIKFPVPGDLTSATFTVKRDDVVVGGPGNAVVGNGVATVELPYAVTAKEGDVKVTLTFTYQAFTQEVSKTVSVVTPYLDLYEIREILEDDDDDKAVQIESAVRHIINTHCGQTFGHYEGLHSVTGSGEDFLRLPERLIRLKSMNGSNYTSHIALRGGGYYLSFKQPWGVPPIRADFDGWNQATAGFIAPPSAQVWGSFADNREYVIDGEWGWSVVPYPIREATKLLVNDYACGDSLYRDRFLTSMTAADWRIQFHDGAFDDTGNVRANQLLSEYVMPRGWVVI